MDQKNKIKVLQKEIVLKYVVALSLIAILSTLTFYTMYSVLKESDNTAEIVNISGKQRMLSQHIALDIHRIHSGFLDKTTLDTHNNDLERQILKSHTQEMLDANKRLSTGILSPTNKYVLSTTIQEMYFGDINLAHRVEMYIQIAEKSFRINDHDTIHQLVKQIDSLSEPLLRDLNKVVQQYQKEGEEKLANMQVLETAAWIATIIILLLEVIFIFQPMVRRIIFLQSENDSVLQHLEDTIEIRTMHLEKANDKLKHLAFHDALTGLRNRLNLEQDIEHAIEMNKEHNSPYAVLMFDIDWFKMVNDEFGHDVGDQVLKEVSSTFLSIVRNEDKVYRAGGEEFVVLLNRISYENTIDIAEKIRLTIQEHKFHADDKEFFKTISCGLYHSSMMRVLDVTSVLKLVDTALYKSKTNGRNQVTSVSGDLIKSLSKS